VNPDGNDKELLEINVSYPRFISLAKAEVPKAGAVL